MDEYQRGFEQGRDDYLDEEHGPGEPNVPDGVSLAYREGYYDGWRDAEEKGE